MGEVHAVARVAVLGFGVQGLSLPIVFWVQASVRSPVQYPGASLPEDKPDKHNCGAGSSGHLCSGPGTVQGLANVTFTLTYCAPPDSEGSLED